MGTISVAMATYNGVRYLSEQLASLAEQTVTPDELVISDDASPDDTLAIARDFAVSAPFKVTVIENAVNVGFARNFERALTECSGDIVFLADQDDIWLPRKLEIVAKRMAGGAPLALHNAICVDEHNTTHDPDLFARLRMLRLTPDWPVKGCCTAVTRDVVRAALPLPAGRAHDSWLHQVARAVGQPVFIDEPLIRYRLHPDHTSVTRLNQLKATKLPWYAPITYRIGKIVHRPSPTKLRGRLAEIERLVPIAEAAHNQRALTRLSSEARSIGRTLNGR